MALAHIKHPIDLPAARVWALVADFGDTSWMPGVTAEVEGDGPGMVRVIPAGDAPIREQLESVDADARRLVYTIPVNVPFPVTGYRATMSVHEAGEGACELEWSCEAAPAEGHAEAEVKAQIEGMYTVMAGWIADRAKAG